MMERKISENLAALEKLLDGHFEQARIIYQNALNKNNVDMHTIAAATHNIAQSYLMEGRLIDAEGYFQQAIELYKATSDEFSLAFCLSQYALLLRHQLKLQEAENVLAEVVKISKKLKLKRQQTNNWFLKPYFLNLLKDFNKREEAKTLRKKLQQVWILE